MLNGPPTQPGVWSAPVPEITAGGQLLADCTEILGGHTKNTRVLLPCMRCLTPTTNSRLSERA